MSLVKIDSALIGQGGRTMTKIVWVIAGVVWVIAIALVVWIITLEDE